MADCVCVLTPQPWKVDSLPASCSQSNHQLHSHTTSQKHPWRSNCTCYYAFPVNRSSRPIFRPVLDIVLTDWPKVHRRIVHVVGQVATVWTLNHVVVGIACFNTCSTRCPSAAAARGFLPAIHREWPPDRMRCGARAHKVLIHHFWCKSIIIMQNSSFVKWKYFILNIKQYLPRATGGGVCLRSCWPATAGETTCDHQRYVNVSAMWLEIKLWWGFCVQLVPDWEWWTVKIVPFPQNRPLNRPKTVKNNIKCGRPKPFLQYPTAITSFSLGSPMLLQLSFSTEFQ